MHGNSLKVELKTAVIRPFRTSFLQKEMMLCTFPAPTCSRRSDGCVAQMQHKTTRVLDRAHGPGIQSACLWKVPRMVIPPTFIRGQR